MGMRSNVDGNTAVKRKRDEQWSLVTLLTACWTANFVVLDWRWTKTDVLFTYCIMLYSLIHFAECRHSLALIGGDGMGWGWVECSRNRQDGVQFLFPCRPVTARDTATRTASERVTSGARTEQCRQSSRRCWREWTTPGRYDVKSDPLDEPSACLQGRLLAAAVACLVRSPQRRSTSHRTTSSKQCWCNVIHGQITIVVTVFLFCHGIYSITLHRV